MKPTESRFLSNLALAELLAAIVDSSEDAIITTMLDGTIVGWNKGAEKIYDYAASEIIGRPIATLVPPDRLDELPAIFARLLEGKIVERYETERLKKGQQRVPVSLTWRPLKNTAQQLIGASLTVTDISQWREAEEARTQAESDFRAVFENAGVGIALVDKEGSLLRANPALERIVGYSEGELRQRSFAEFSHPDDTGPELILHRQLVAGTREYYQIEKRIIRRDGGIVWARVTASRRPPIGNQPVFGVAVVEDITGRKRAEELARESQQRLALLVKQSPLPVISWDLDFRVTEWNPAAEKIFGYTKEEALGQHGSFLMAESAVSLVNQVWKDLLNASGGTRSTNESRTKSGAVILCEWYNKSLIDRSGRVIGVASLVQDVTAQHEVEQRLRQAQKLEAIGQLAGGVAHDFNNLLNVIIGHIALMRNAALDDTARAAHAHEIENAANRAAALTRQLLAFSRKQVLQPEVLDLHEVVTAMSKMLERVIGEDIRMQITGRDQCFVRADRSQIEQVIMNLVVNARDAMPHGGDLALTTAPVKLDTDAARKKALAPGHYVTLSVADTGHGMDAATRARIFEPFFTTKEVGKGTGLGLATVHGVIEQSGGAVAVESKMGAGTTFTVFLPCAGAARPLPPVTTRAAEVQPGTETILLVEDEAALRVMMRQILEQSGYTVLEAPHGPAAIAISQTDARPIDLLITDMVMPGMGGYEVAKRIAQQRPAMRVLYISGYADRTLEQAPSADPRTSLLEKPFTPDALLARLSELLAPMRQSQVK